MSNTAKWIAGAGQGLTWGAAFGAEINSLAAGSVAVSSIVIANGTALDLYADVSFALTGTTPASGAAYFALYLLALNQDASTYGDATASGTVLPGGSYLVASVPVPLSQTSAVLTGIARGIILPPGSFKFAIANQTGNALAASANTIAYRTYNENLNG